MGYPPAHVPGVPTFFEIAQQYAALQQAELQQAAQRQAAEAQIIAMNAERNRRNHLLILRH
jgi:hypothetical protein